MWSVELIDSTSSIPRHETERLLVVATGLSRSNLAIGVELSDEHVNRFRDLLARRESNEPLQYIEGSVPFGPVEVAVDKRVLIPRPETEYLFELVAKAARDPQVIVDLCTGSGNLAIALKRAFPEAEVYGTDLSADALVVAHDNAERNGVDVRLLEGDLFAPLPDELRGSVDLLVANPPYLADMELGQVPSDVLQEPHMALVSGPGGDEIVSAIAADIGEWLSPTGQFAIEVSEFHASKVAGRFSGFGAKVVEDLSGRERFVMSVSLVE